jgi:hypothetical protein
MFCLFEQCLNIIHRHRVLSQHAQRLVMSETSALLWPNSKPYKNSTVFRDMMPYGVDRVRWCLRKTHCLYLQGEEVKLNICSEGTLCWTDTAKDNS